MGSIDSYILDDSPLSNERPGFVFHPNTPYTQALAFTHKPLSVHPCCEVPTSFKLLQVKIAVIHSVVFDCAKARNVLIVHIVA